MRVEVRCGTINAMSERMWNAKQTGGMAAVYIVFAVGIFVLAAGAGTRWFLERNQAGGPQQEEEAILPAAPRETPLAPKTSASPTVVQAEGVSPVPNAYESKIACNTLTPLPRQSLGFFFMIDGAPALGSHGPYFVQYTMKAQREPPASPRPGASPDMGAFFGADVAVTEFGADGIPGTIDDRTTKIADAAFSSIAADGNNILFGDGDKLMWYSLGTDGIPKTSDDVGPRQVAEKFIANLEQPAGSVSLAGNNAMYAVQTSSAPQPSPYSFLGSKNTYATVYHNFGPDGIPGTNDDYKTEVLTSEYRSFGQVSRTGKFIAGGKLYDLGPNRTYDQGDPRNDDSVLEGQWTALSSDGRYAVSTKGPTILGVYDAGLDGQIGTADDKRSEIPLKNVKQPSQKKVMMTFGGTFLPGMSPLPTRVVEGISHDSGTGISYIVIDGPHLAFRREVAVWEYMGAGPDGRFGTGDDYVGDVVTSTGPDNKKILADQNPRLVGNVLSLDGGFGATYFYKFCRP